MDNDFRKYVVIPIFIAVGIIAVVALLRTL